MQVAVGREAALHRQHLNTEESDSKEQVPPVHHTRSKYAETLTSINPNLNKKLNAVVNDIDGKKRMRATEMFLAQRKFFLQAAFDNNSRLRFASQTMQNDEKLPVITFDSQNLPRDTDCSTTQTSCTADYFPQLGETDKPQGNELLTRCLFMKQGEEITANKDRIMQAESRLYSSKSKQANAPKERGKTRAKDARNSGMQQTFLMRGSSDSCIDLRRKGLSTSMSYSLQDVFMGTTQTRDHCRTAPVYKLDAFPSVTPEIENKKPQHRKERCASFPEVKKTSVIFHKSENGPNRHIKSSEKARRDQLNNDYTALTFRDEDLSARRSLRHERLLRKLIQSLPVDILSQTEKSEKSLAQALGFEKRRGALLRREQAKRVSLGLHHPRFGELVHELCTRQ